MRIAITSQNFRTITGHAGKTRRFLIVEADGQTPAREIERLDLPSGMSLHDYAGEDHPLFAQGVEVLITQGAGRGLMQRLQAQGIRVHTTAASDPLQAANDLAAGRVLPVAQPHSH